jgi:hypothetical protein
MVSRPSISVRETSVWKRLEQLRPSIDAAYEFAENWPEVYRPEVFRLAMEMLSGHEPRVDPVVARPQAKLVNAPVGPASESLLDDPLTRLAAALGVDVPDLERAVHFTPDTPPQILGRIEGKSVRDSQIKYSVVYCYVQEFALRNRHISIEDLRRLCIEHACYDKQNFSTNFKKASEDDLLREIAERAGGTRKLMATKKGLELGAQILREMIQG